MYEIKTSDHKSESFRQDALADETPGNLMKSKFEGFDKYKWQVELPIKPSDSKLCGNKDAHCAITGSDFFKYTSEYFKVSDSGNSVLLMVPPKKDLPAGLSAHGGPRAELKTGCDVKGGLKFDPTKSSMHWLKVDMAVQRSGEHELTVAQMHGAARATVLVHWTGKGLQASFHGGGFRSSDKKTISSKCWKDKDTMSTKGASQTILQDWKEGQRFTLQIGCGNNQCEFHVNGKPKWTHKFSERDSCSIGDCGIWHTGAYGTDVEVEIFDITFSDSLATSSQLLIV